jgi:hypothetical protein
MHNFTFSGMPFLLISNFFLFYLKNKERKEKTLHFVRSFPPVALLRFNLATSYGT